MSTAVVAADSGGLVELFHRWVRLARIFLFTLVGITVFFILIEGAHIYSIASNINPMLGYSWLATLAAGMILLGIPAYRFLKVPKVVQPPLVPDIGALEIEHLKAEVAYLDRYLAHLRTNREMAEKIADVDEARRSLATLAAVVRQGTSAQLIALNDQLCDWTKRTMTPLLAELDQKAERMIYQESLGVGIATAASPNGTLDAFVMLWRSLNLVSKMANLYYGRPGLWGTLAICRDVSVATAVAGYLHNVTDSLGGLIAKTVGGMTGMVAGPAVEGITNSLVLIRIGYLAQNRCRSFRKWDAGKRRSAIVESVAATQRVALGITTEIVRQVGGGLTAVVGVAGRSAVKVADNVTSAVGSAVNKAVAWGQSFSSSFQRKQDPDAADGS